MKAIMDNLKMLPQEMGGKYKFDGKMYFTQGFLHEFGEDAQVIEFLALRRIITERVNSAEGADYLQIFKYKDRKFWIIDDISHITALLPEEY